MNGDNNKQNDTDALDTEDILPPYNKNIHQKQDLQETEADKIKGASSQNGPKQSFEATTSPLAGGKANRAKELPTEPAGAVQERSEIPKFDLAEQILAEQRKITAIRRKAPGKSHRLPSLAPAVTRVQSQDGAAGKKPKTPDRQPQAQSTDYVSKQPPSILSEQEQIIAEIVARDIEKL